MKKILIFLILILSTNLYSVTVEQKIKAVDNLISKLKKELILLKQGKKNVNGYAMYGFNCPKRFITGDDSKDQYFSSRARIRVIKKELEVLSYLKKQYQTQLRQKQKHYRKFYAVLKELDGKDYGGRYEKIEPDGGFDYPLVLEVNFPGKKIKNIVVKNINGIKSVWDTIPNNGMWALVVTEYGEILQKRNSALKKPIPAVGKYTLYLPDNKSIFKGNTNYKITLYFTDGTKKSKEVLKRLNSGKKRLSARLLGLSKKDYGGNYERIKPDGKRDYVVKVEIKNCKLKKIKEIMIKNTSGKFSVWDTVPNNRYWALAVEKNGRLVSKRDSSVNILLKTNNETLYLYLPDNGSIKRGATHYKLFIFFADGNRLTCKIKR
ncbi:hypothetical protein TTHT_2033 [Thermotomaculum hydrothermale]|uniref:Uncharacterized protein n=1 Tax=Thermotomaculum hydrothermale TaxID=981385 RepID=A0A7R6PPJ9_9BACT|nr:hypothetical protein [Thermotomaculum hydrothermale]BBB33473.1 hypothetical protein TTHT_2033 [Thermotomaculum hydrothermale]